jgi:5-methylcytosine-specific restriction endonuclease McrA
MPSQNRRVINQHLEYYGLWCPGAPDEGHEPHYLNPGDELSIDHIVPLSEGGTDEWFNKRVLCTGWNSRREHVENRP